MVGALLFLIGVGLVLWGAERLTDGALGARQLGRGVGSALYLRPKPRAMKLATKTITTRSASSMWVST